MKFSANLGFLWTDRPLPAAIRAAKAAGFDAVECHWPYDTSPDEIVAALEETGLSMLGLNTRRGDVSAGFNGLAALPKHLDEAREAIDEAISYARVIKCKSVHVMAGYANGQGAYDTFVANLSYACDQAAPHGITILIEPLNGYDAPGYFLTDTTLAVSVIDKVNRENLKLMFDCYHVQLTEGNLTHRIANLLPYIGHIQFASVPDRGSPDHGEVNYQHIFSHIAALGYATPLGAEYKPTGLTDGTLSWLRTLKAG